MCCTVENALFPEHWTLNTGNVHAVHTQCKLWCAPCSKCAPIDICAEHRVHTDQDMVALRVPQAAAVDLQPHIWQQVKSQPSLDFQGVWWNNKKNERGKMQSSEQSGKIWQWEISWVQIWGNRKSLFYFVLKPKPQTSTLWIVAIWLYRAVKMTRGFILSTAIAVNVAIFHSHALPDHRVNFSYLEPANPKALLMLNRLWSFGSRIPWSGVRGSKGLFQEVGPEEPQDFSCSQYFASLPNWGTFLRNPWRIQLHRGVDWLARRFGWFWTDYWRQGRELLISAKQGKRVSPQSPFCPNTLSAVCRLRGISRSGGAFYQICKSPSTANQQTLPVRTVSIALSTPGQSKTHQCAWRNCNIVPS